MKKKDVVTVLVCLAMIGGSLFFMLNMMSPKPAPTTDNPENNNVATEITGDFDEKTLEELKKLNDYGEATLENIGRANPFGTIN